MVSKCPTQYLQFNRAFTEAGWVNEPVITIIDGLISDIQPYKSEATQGYADQIEQIDATLMPGLIDTHIHGALGHDVMDASHEALNEISGYLASFGIVGFLATTVTSHLHKLEAALLQVKQSKQIGLDGAELLGSYLEGPYFTERNKGAHPERLLRDIDLAELQQLITVADGTLKAVALAPEKSGSMEAIEYLKKQDINVMLAHTDADYETTTAALNAGATGIVHCYNGMRGIHHRDVGTVGAGITHPKAFVEMICDGHHVHPAAVDIAYRCCGDRLMLISDSMRAAGMPNGKYELGEYLITMKDGVVRTDTGSLAGSTLCLKNAVDSTAKWLNIEFEKSWALASSTPAKALNIETQLGSIALGKKASMVALNEQGDVLHTWVTGNRVYSK